MVDGVKKRKRKSSSQIDESPSATSVAPAASVVIDPEVLPRVPSRAESQPSTPIEPEVVVEGEAEVIATEITPDEVQTLVAGAPLPEVVEEEAEDAAPVPARRGKSALAPAKIDALEAYFREISRYPTLTREEEHALAVRYIESKDLEAAKKLVYGNLWLVVKIAREYERAARNILDLIQEGNMGLMEAVKNFDPFRGVRLPSYAVWWIKAYIVRYVIANWRLVKIGTTQAQRKLFFNLRKEKEKLEREGFIATPKLIAEKLDVRESDVLEMEQRMSAPDASVDAPLGADSESSLLSVLPAEGQSADTLLAAKQFQSLLKENLEAFSALLNEKQRSIFERRMIAEEKATLQEISDDLGVSKERVRQIENQVRDKLKAFLTEHMGNALEEREIS